MGFLIWSLYFIPFVAINLALAYIGKDWNIHEANTARMAWFASCIPVLNLFMFIGMCIFAIHVYKFKNHGN